MNRWAALLLAGTLLPPCGLAAEPVADPAAPIAVRTGGHPGFGRVVIDVGPAASYKLTRDGDTLTVTFGGAMTFAQPGSAPRNVRSVRVSPGQVMITIAPGAKPRDTRINGHVVIDVLDSGAAAPAAAPTAAPAAAPAPAPAPAAAPPVAKAAPPGPEASTAPAVVRPNTPAAKPPASPAAAEVKRTTPPPDDLSFTVPINPKAGAALFTLGNTTFVVFDERWSLDLTGLGATPGLANTQVQELPAATVIALHPPQGASVSLTPARRGWKIGFEAAAAPRRPITLTATANQLAMAAESPGAVVTLAAPDSGATLLVGTVRNGPPGAQAQGIETGLRTPEFVLAPTQRGVLVEPLADTIGLRAVNTGFVLYGASDGLVITLPTKETVAKAAARHLTERFNVPHYAPDALVRQMQDAIAAAATAPPGARGPKRREAAMAMLSLGMASEAEALLRVAAAEDPREAASPDTIGLTAIAAILAGRLDEAVRINDPVLGESDEVALWRAVLQSLRDEVNPAEPAATFAVTAPLALLYPAGIRDALVPRMVETMILGGAIPAAKQLLARASDTPGWPMPARFSSRWMAIWTAP